jgi:hypothetical protein
VFDNPRLGRFMQTDPVGYKDDYDLYTYVGDDPMSHTDPQGTVLKLAVAVVKMAVKGENLYSTVQGIVENIETIASPSASTGEKALAALSIVMDVTSGINVKDVKNVANAVSNLKHYSGTAKPWTHGATPNSVYTHIDPKTGLPVQNAVYDANGKVKAHVDFKDHGPGAPPGHAHTFHTPGDPSSGHGKAKPHIAPKDVPPEWVPPPPRPSPRP